MKRVPSKTKLRKERITKEIKKIHKESYEIYEDYHAIYAFAHILERYLCKEQLSEKIYCLSQRNLELLKRNEKIFDEIVKNSYKNW